MEALAGMAGAATHRATEQVAVAAQAVVAVALITQAVKAAVVVAEWGYLEQVLMAQAEIIHLMAAAEVAAAQRVVVPLLRREARAVHMALAVVALGLLLAALGEWARFALFGPATPAHSHLQT
jgi:hypothetical protein